MSSDKRLLVIDDEPDFRTFIRRVGEKLGFAVETAAEGNAFKALYERFDPTVIVLDILMPEPDGIELIQWLAANRCSARVLIISGYDPHYAHAAESIGSAYGTMSIARLRKPVSVAELTEALG